MRAVRPPSRRGVLIGSATLALSLGASACDATGRDTEGSEQQDPQDDRTQDDGGPDTADRRRLEAVTAGIEEALALVTATMAAHPSTTARLTPLAECHRVHLGAAGSPSEPTESPTASPSTGSSASPGADASPSAEQPPVARSAPRALAAVSAREAELLALLSTESTAAESGALARLLAVLAAGLGTHVATLGVTPGSTPSTERLEDGSTAGAEALQEVLAAEHAAVFVLAAFGGAVSATSFPDTHALLTERHRAHRAQREFLTTTLRGLGEVPVAAAPAYVVPQELEDDELATRTAVTVEHTCAEEYATLVGRTTGERRRWAVDTLAESARALVGWGETPQPFPGAPELARDA